MASVMPKYDGMKNCLARVLRMRPCNVDEVSALSSTDHAGMSRIIFQHGRTRLSYLLPYNCECWFESTYGQPEPTVALA